MSKPECNSPESSFIDLHYSKPQGPQNAETAFISSARKLEHQNMMNTTSRSYLNDAAPKDTPYLTTEIEENTALGMYETTKAP